MRRNRNNYPPTEEQEIFETLEQVQPNLLNLYTGDYKEFNDLICMNCKHLAIDPKDCGECGELICKPCQNQEQIQKCLGCDTAFDSLRNTSKVVLNLFKNATFACPNECSATGIILSQVEMHLQELCDRRLVECPLGCDELVQYSKLQQHKLSECATTKLISCPDCDGLYRYSEQKSHSCVRFMKHVLREAIGKEAFNQASDKVRNKFNYAFDPFSESEEEAYELAPAPPGTLESILAQQIGTFQNSMKLSLQSFMNRSQKAETSFKDQIKETLYMQMQQQNQVSNRLNQLIKDETQTDRSPSKDTFTLPGYIDNQDPHILAGNNSSIQFLNRRNKSVVRDDSMASSNFSIVQGLGQFNSKRKSINKNASPLPPLQPLGHFDENSIQEKIQSVRAAHGLVPESRERTNFDPDHYDSNRTHSTKKDYSGNEFQSFGNPHLSRIRQHESDDEVFSAEEPVRKEESFSPTKTSGTDGTLNSVQKKSFTIEHTPRNRSKHNNNEDLQEFDYQNTLKSCFSPKYKPSQKAKMHMSGFTSVNSRKHTGNGMIRKLPLSGEANSEKQGYSTFEWHGKMNDAGPAPIRVSKIQFWVGGSLCALRLIMTDGSKSPKFGKFHPLDKEVTLSPGEKVRYVSLRGDDEYVEALSFLDQDKKPALQIEGSFNKGNTQVHELQEDEEVIGCYGIFNYQPYVVGLGLILWKPAVNYTTDD